MEKLSIFNYLEKRQLGYACSKKNVHNLFITQLGYKKVQDGLKHNAFACKFSKNKSNLHIVGCSSEYGAIIIQNTLPDDNYSYKINELSDLHRTSIINFAWAEPQMKILTASADMTSKLCSLGPSGVLQKEKEFTYESTVQSVMFSPGSSDVFCSGFQDGSIKISDARVNYVNNINNFTINIPNAHGINRSVARHYKTRKVLSTVIFKDAYTVISSLSMDPVIKVWDLRKTTCQLKGNTEAYPLSKYFSNINSIMDFGYMDMTINPQSTHLYASGINNIIYCYFLNSLKNEPLCQYSGHYNRNCYSKISISNDGHYLFTGCMNYGGIIYLTDFPYIEEPVFKMYNNVTNYTKELYTSDWCADPSYFKLATSYQSTPLVWSISTMKEIKSCRLKFSRTAYFRSTPNPRKTRTVPIRMNPELKKKYTQETEENMEISDEQNQ